MSQSTSLHDLRALLQQGAGAFRSPLSLPRQRETGEHSSWLPKGLSAGEISEWIALEDGSGAAELALSSVCGQLPADSRWLMIDPQGETYAPALVQRGLDLSRVLLVQTQDAAEAFWAAEQGLRSRGVDVVCCRLPRLAPLAFRRLKLAAEAGESRCLLLRGPEALRETSWADVRLLVTPLLSPSWRRRHFRVEILKVKNSVPGRAAQAEFDDETGVVRVVSKLADSTD
ncbi:MAG: hypothetical protein KF774_19255 [Planctomyces sp.]|nr:hypothetical protein [Planctomyces sp.]